MMTDKEKTICLKETVAKLWEILPLQEKKNFFMNLLNLIRVQKG